MQNKADILGKWAVSPWNYSEDVLKEISLPSEPVFHDQTLRDGVQFSGIEFSDTEKVELAIKLGEIGNKRIEVGRISSDAKNLKVIERIATSGTGMETYGFVEMSIEDVKRAANCGLEGVVLCFPANDHAIVKKCGLTYSEVIKTAAGMLSTANDLGLKTVLFGTDASRATPAFYADLMQKILSQGNVDSLTFVDTIGGCSPIAIPCIMCFLKNMTQKPWEVHFHNDFGLATANTVLALAYGASVAHTTILGIGERAGNAAFQEVITILTAMFGTELGLKLDKLYDLCEFVSMATGFPVPKNSPIIGEKIFEIVNSNMLVFSTLPEELAVKYVFPFHWSVVGQQPASFALSSQCSLSELELVLKRGKITNVNEQLKRNVLNNIRNIAQIQKRSVCSEEILSML